jgi:hypothetical protein
LARSSGSVQIRPVEPGDCIANRYRLLHLISVGGMGEVWAARNELTQRSFAIKFLLKTLEHRSDVFERFIREAETAGRLQHPSIVDVYDVAQTEDGRPFIVMELLAGETLEAHLEREGHLPAFRVAAVVAQVAQALDLAHRAGVVHRDLSSANIFLARNPEGGEAIPKILDFGVSKTTDSADFEQRVTHHGALLGCPEYMSPEQACGAEGVDLRTDIWALGVLAYQCLTGALPFQANNFNSMMAALLTRPHRPLLEAAPATDPELAAVVEACLLKDRRERIQSAQEVATRLRAVARRLSVELGVPGGAPRRRATDRFDRDGAMGASEVVVPAWLSPVAGVVSRVGALRPRRVSVGLACGLVGLLVGVIGTQTLVKVADGATAVSEVPGSSLESSEDKRRALGAERVAAVAADQEGAPKRARPR